MHSWEMYSGEMTNNLALRGQFSSPKQKKLRDLQVKGTTLFIHAIHPSMVQNRK